MKLVWLAALVALPVTFTACATGVDQPSGGGSQPSSGGAGGGASSSASASASASSSGSGPCTSAADCAGSGDACNTGACVNGVCGKLPANEFGACDDGLNCTENDTCQRGVCTGGTTKFCPATDTCSIGSCDLMTDMCTQVPGNDGAQCNDDDACTLPGSCLGGVCNPGGMVDCSFLDGTCSEGYCDSQVGCKVMPKADGAPCNDNLYCTVNDTCDNGQCSGVPNTCAAPGDVCMIGSCDEANDKCTAVPGNNGAACNDNNLCTTGETCSNGLCVGGAPTNNGAACDDGNGCTNGTTCSNGVCGNPTSMVMACINADGCCPAGCVAVGDSDCSVTKWSEGTMEWPDEACNPQNSFGTCDTNAQNHADAWATFVCVQNGFSSGIWTGNKAPGCTGEVSMYCGGNIPCTPIWEFMCFASDQTKVEITCFP